MTAQERTQEIEKRLKEASFGPWSRLLATIISYGFPTEKLYKPDVTLLTYASQDIEFLLNRLNQLEGALEGLTNAALAGLKPLPSQVEAGFNALKGDKE